MEKLQLNFLDKTINAISPAWGAQRARDKFAIKALCDTGYVTPGSNKRSMLNWNPMGKTADDSIVPKLSEMRAGSRDFATNNPIAIAALERVKMNAVGKGLTLQSTLDWEYLKMSEEDGIAWIKNTEREFLQWAKSKECDIARTSNFYQLQSQAIYNALLDGDCFAIFPYVKRKKQKYDMRIKLITAESCDTPMNSKDESIVAGIKKDDDAPESYFFQKEKKGLFVSEYNDNPFVEIKAYSESGKKMVHHIFIKKLLNQTRGIPFLAAVVEPLKQIKTLSDSELMSSIIASFLTVFLKKMSAGVEGFAASNLPGISDPSEHEDDGTTPEQVTLGAGAIVSLKDGEEIDVVESKRPNAAFEAFYYSFVKQIGMSLNIPFEELTLHFQSSYSAARAAILKAWQFYMTQREWISCEFCQPVYEDWLEHAIYKGTVKAPGFFDDESIRFAYTSAKWEGSSMGQIDPLKEINAIEKALNLLLTDRETESKKLNGGNGGRWTDILKRNVSEKRAMEAAGISPISSDDSQSNETNQKTEDEDEE